MAMPRILAGIRGCSSRYMPKNSTMALTVMALLLSRGLERILNSRPKAPAATMHQPNILERAAEPRSGLKNNRLPNRIMEREPSS